MTEKFENNEGTSEIVLDNSEGELRKVQFDSQTGLFRLQLKNKSSSFNEGPWVAGRYLKDILAQQVPAVEYRKALDFVEQNDPQQQ